MGLIQRLRLFGDEKARKTLISRSQAEISSLELLFVSCMPAMQFTTASKDASGS